MREMDRSEIVELYAGEDPGNARAWCDDLLAASTDLRTSALFLSACAGTLAQIRAEKLHG